MSNFERKVTNGLPEWWCLTPKKYLCANQDGMETAYQLGLIAALESQLKPENGEWVTDKWELEVLHSARRSAIRKDVEDKGQ